MSTVGDVFRCAAASRERGDAAAGTASTVRSFLLVEHPGPWGIDALRDARLPDGFGRRLVRESHRAGVRVLLVRRPGRSTGAEVRVFAAHVAGAGSWLETTVVGDVAEVSQLDLDALGRGRRLGLTPHERPVLAVCTHGRHDACCAERGRPVARALAAGPHADDVWECSHIGGDRFAGNLLVLPHGLYYGGLDPASAVLVAEATAWERLVLDHLRGRSDLPMPVQAAEIALRRQVDLVGFDDVVFLGHRRDEDSVVSARFDVGARGYVVRVRTSPEQDAHLLTCRATSASYPPRHEVLSIDAL